MLKGRGTSWLMHHVMVYAWFGRGAACKWCCVLRGSLAFATHAHHVTINLSVLFISHLPSLWHDPLIIALDAFPHR